MLLLLVVCLWVVFVVGVSLLVSDDVVAGALAVGCCCC
jgi:hypothetical protein